MTAADDRDETRLLDEPATPSALQQAIRAARAQGTTPAQRALMLAAAAPLIGASAATAAAATTTAAAATTAKLGIGLTLAAAAGGAAAVGALVWSLATPRHVAQVARHAPGVVSVAPSAPPLAPPLAPVASSGPAPAPTVAPGRAAPDPAEGATGRTSSPRHAVSSAKRPVVRAEAPAEAGGTEAGSSAAPAQPAITEGLKLLERARAALAHDPALASTLALRHRQMFPNGPMVQEREVIAIEALVRLGRNDEANTRARQFHRDFPDSIHLRHIDALLAPATP